MRKLTTQEFIDKANRIHNNKYDYSKVNYIRSSQKVKIICKQHGEFKKTPNDHINGQGCKKCTYIKLQIRRKLTTQEFIDKANRIHNNKYDYSKVNYINNHTKIKIICPKHGKFIQSPNNHIIKKHGCQKCGNSNKLTTQEFIDKANRIHNNKYDYSKVNYINSKTKIKIICPKHGKFVQTPEKHMIKRGCYLCNGGTLLTTREFIDKAKLIHGSKYNYSKVNYINNHTKIKIICPKHDEFLQTPNVHLLNSGCPKCSHTVSKGQIKWLNNLEKENNIIIERNLTIHIGNKYFYPDGFYKPTNTWYEYNGYYFHGHPDKYNPNDINKINNKTFGELYKQTLNKERIIKNAGYNLIIKWGK